MRLSSILRNSHFCAWLRDRNGKFVDVNDAFLKLVNKSYKDIIDKTSHEIWNNENSYNSDKRCQEVIEKD